MYILILKIVYTIYNYIITPRARVNFSFLCFISSVVLRSFVAVMKRREREDRGENVDMAIVVIRLTNGMKETKIINSLNLACAAT
jgi:hypothetical protein